MRRFPPLTRYQSGYVPRWVYRTEDAYVWRVAPRVWRLRVNESFSDHPTLREACEEMTRRLGLVKT